MTKVLINGSIIESAEDVKLLVEDVLVTVSIHGLVLERIDSDGNIDPYSPIVKQSWARAFDELVQK